MKDDEVMRALRDTQNWLRLKGFRLSLLLADARRGKEMSIEQFHGIYTPTCDICGEELLGEFDFYDAVDEKKRAGWKSQKVNGKWEDVCCDCQDKNA